MSLRYISRFLTEVILMLIYRLPSHVTNRKIEVELRKILRVCSGQLMLVNLTPLRPLTRHQNVRFQIQLIFNS